MALTQFQTKSKSIFILRWIKSYNYTLQNIQVKPQPEFMN